MPSDECERNSRRVRCWRYSLSGSTTSLLAQGFVEIQNGQGQCGPGGMLRGIDGRIARVTRPRPRVPLPPRDPRGTLRGSARRRRAESSVRPRWPGGPTSGGKHRPTAAARSSVGHFEHCAQASARAASTNVVSFSVKSACNGVLVRKTLTVQVCREALSKNSVGAVIRRQKV